MAHLEDLSDLSWIYLFILSNRKSDELSENLLNLWVQQEGRVWTKTTEYQPPGKKTKTDYWAHLLDYTENMLVVQ